MLDELIKRKIVRLVADMSINYYDSISKVRVFPYLFDELGDIYYYIKKENGYYIEKLDNDDVLSGEGNDIIESTSTIDNLIAAFGGIKFQFTSSCIYIAGERIIIQLDLDTSIGNKIESISLITNRDDLETVKSLITGSLVFKNEINDENSYKIAYKGQYSIETTEHKFNEWKTNIEKNYNDDVPFAEMNAIIRDDKASLIMLYGIPGTGKSSIIKSLINENRETNFIFMDDSICDSISNGQLLDFLQENKNSVLVFEDCEKLLQSRSEVKNGSIGTILNLTDGIIAESMKTKFICTFNCSLSEIDPALLRKGRLSLKYEFKELSLEKTKAIYPEAKEPMTLADAYNAHKKNDFSVKKVKKIGFA